VKSLGWEKIDCIEVSDDDIDAELWEIAENLHRAELTALERDTQVARWIELTTAKQIDAGNASQLATHKKRGQQPGGVNAASRELGISKDDAHRAIKVASLSDEAKHAARDAGIDDNRTALLAVAKETSKEAQVAKVVEIARAKAEPKRGRKNVVASVRCERGAETQQPTEEAGGAAGDSSDGISMLIEALSTLADLGARLPLATLLDGIAASEVERLRGKVAAADEYLSRVRMVLDRTGKAVGVDHKTVAAARTEVENFLIPHHRRYCTT
jgi:ParB family chromosome partitioning protein